MDEDKQYWYMVNYAGGGNVGWITISRDIEGSFTDKDMRELTEFCRNHSKAEVVITGLVYLGYMTDGEFYGD